MSSTRTPSRSAAPPKPPTTASASAAQRKFFVEAKKPAVNIKDDLGPAYQLRRYAWSAKLPLSILTDFEEFAVYDCRIKPDKTDKASTARILYYTYRRVPRHAGTRSPPSSPAMPSSRARSTRYAESTKAKRGTAEVDDAFLKEIESWRDTLARNIALRNPALTPRAQLRRPAHHRPHHLPAHLRGPGHRAYGQLQASANGANIYAACASSSTRPTTATTPASSTSATKRDAAEPPDESDPRPDHRRQAAQGHPQAALLPRQPLRVLRAARRHPRAGLRAVPGKVIRLTAGHQAKVEEKPEVKKAGGVYYTPTYIVDYIVRNTVGKLLEGKTPEAGGASCASSTPPAAPAPS